MKVNNFNKVIYFLMFIFSCFALLLICENAECIVRSLSGQLWGDKIEYDVELTCDTNAVNQALLTPLVQSCFSSGGGNVDTFFELKNGDQYGIYTASNLLEVGKRGNDGNSLHIPAKKHFSIRAQNSSADFILTLKITDLLGHIKFEKSVGQYGIIEVEN